MLRHELRALLTGGAGFIGSHLAERIAGDGHGVIAVDAFTDYYDPARKRANFAAVEGSGVELIEGDLNELDLPKLVRGVDVVFHLAGQPGVRASWGDSFGVYLDQNVHATQRLLEACKAASTERFVYASSSSIYGDAERFPTGEDDLPAPISPYGVTKLAAEHLCRLYFRAYGLPAVSLRYFTIYGPRQRPDMAFTRFIAATLEGEPLVVYGDGEQVRDFTYVADAVSATYAAATSGEPGRVYNIAGGTQTSVREVIETIGELIGREPQVENREPVAGDARRTGADTSRARQDLGYAPSVDLREGLSRQVAHAQGDNS
jgi:nucleoside-diphosphate-sugar epimerase